MATPDLRSLSLHEVTRKYSTYYIPNLKGIFIIKNLTYNRRIALKARRIVFRADKRTHELEEAGGNAVSIEISHVGNIDLASSPCIIQSIRNSV